MHKQPHKWGLTVLALSIFLIAGSMGVAEAGPRIQFGGWVTYWDFKRGMETVDRGTGIFQDIFLFSVHLDSDGSPIAVNNESIDYISTVNHLKASGFKPWLSFVNDVMSPDRNKAILKDSSTVHKIFAKDVSRRRHRREIIHLAEKYGASGVDIDYENLLPTDQLLFSRFISELSADLKKREISLSVTVQPKIRESSSPGKGAMDWAEICQHADRLQIMLYNLHNQKTQPGPVATLDWISSVLKYAKSQCDLKTIVPVLKISGMHWGTRKNETVQYDRAMALKARHGALLERDTTSQVPFFSYKTNDESGIVYFEDAHSLKIKIERIQSLGFKKVVFWSFGRQDPQLISQLKNLF